MAILFALLLLTAICVFTCETSAVGQQSAPVWWERGPMSPIYVDPDTHWYKDKWGRVVIFRGINMVIKGPPWYPEMMLDPVHIEEMKSWGFNVLRLGTMWAGIEPQMNKYDEDYMEKIDIIVDSLEKRGVYTVFDMHQDVISSKFDGYDGVPLWLIEQFPEPEHPYPWPLKNPRYWECGYITQAASSAFQHLYDNYAGAADKMAAVWKFLAARYTGKASVLGYELINEPWAGDIYSDATYVLSGIAGYKNLAPLYDKIHKAIREVDDETLIFWEPVVWGYILPTTDDNSFAQLIDLYLGGFLSSHSMKDILQYVTFVCGDLQEAATEGLIKHFKDSGRNITQTRSYLGTGFTTVPGGADYQNRTVLSWHYYCWLVEKSPSDTPYDKFTRALCDSLMGPTVFNTRTIRREEVGGGSMLTEFGTCTANVSNTDSTGYIECEFVLELCDKNFVSWNYWDTAGGGVFWDAEGKVLTEHVKLFSRPYPRATSGLPYSFNFDPATRIFTYIFKLDTTIDAPTEMYVPPLWYPNGKYHVQKSPWLSWTIDDADPNIVLFWSNKNIEVDSEYSMIQVTPISLISGESEE